MAQMETIMPINESAPSNRLVAGRVRYTLPPCGRPPGAPSMAPLRVSLVVRFANAIGLLLIECVWWKMRFAHFPPNTLNLFYCAVKPREHQTREGEALAVKYESIASTE